MLGPEHPDTLANMNRLAQGYQYQGRYDKAEQLYIETLEIQKRVLSPDHWVTVDTMKKLANLYRKQGRIDEAEDLWPSQKPNDREQTESWRLNQSLEKKHKKEGQ